MFDDGFDFDWGGLYGAGSSYGGYGSSWGNDPYYTPSYTPEYTSITVNAAQYDNPAPPVYNNEVDTTPASSGYWQPPPAVTSSGYWDPPVVQTPGGWDWGGQAATNQYYSPVFNGDQFGGWQAAYTPYSGSFSQSYATPDAAMAGFGNNRLLNPGWYDYGGYNFSNFTPQFSGGSFSGWDYNESAQPMNTITAYGMQTPWGFIPGPGQPGHNPQLNAYATSLYQQFGYQPPRAWGVNEPTAPVWHAPTFAPDAPTYAPTYTQPTYSDATWVDTTPAAGQPTWVDTTPTAPVEPTGPSALPTNATPAEAPNPWAGMHETAYNYPLSYAAPSSAGDGSLAWNRALSGADPSLAGWEPQTSSSPTSTVAAVPVAGGGQTLPGFEGLDQWDPAGLDSPQDRTPELARSVSGTSAGGPLDSKPAANPGAFNFGKSGGGGGDIGSGLGGLIRGLIGGTGSSPLGGLAGIASPFIAANTPAGRVATESVPRQRDAIIDATAQDEARRQFVEPIAQTAASRAYEFNPDNFGNMARTDAAAANAARRNANRRNAGLRGRNQSASELRQESVVGGLNEQTSDTSARVAAMGGQSALLGRAASMYPATTGYQQASAWSALGRDARGYATEQSKNYGSAIRSGAELFAGLFDDRNSRYRFGP